MSGITLALLLFADASTVRVRDAEGDASLPSRLLLVGLPLTVALGTLLAHLMEPSIVGALFVWPVLTGQTHWAAIGYAVLVLTVVRMLPVALSLMGLGMHRSTVLFMGWFGPRGLASVVFTLVEPELGPAHELRMRKRGLFRHGSQGESVDQRDIAGPGGEHG